uniref:5-formyltetrahydrofolate cyclo-ligase n=1 Tax=Chrysotila carterae TaxID=13221 RepID=A0A7S4C4I1_CHRCT|mmetsp:Transcript_41272/g.86413  ORF Transcript_41272/g.86413 Transcript_41272/m.86413 type:complete len:217 (+) Transcript_41272:145-795(+)
MCANAASKSALRKQMKMALRTIPAAAVLAASEAVCARVIALEPVSSCTAASVYLAMPSGECQTLDIIRHLFEQDKKVFVPRIAGRGREQMQMIQMQSMQQVLDLPRDSWGIPAVPDSQVPADADRVPAEIDLVLVPGVAFDLSCRRLGHGKGYYDSFLERLQQSRAALGSPPAATVALALEQQLVDAVPVDAHDVQMDMLCLPTRLCARPTGDTAS